VGLKKSSGSQKRRVEVPPNVDNGMTVDAEIKVVGLGIYE